MEVYDSEGVAMAANTAMLVYSKESDGESERKREGQTMTGHSENDPRDVCRIFPMVHLL